MSLRGNSKRPGFTLMELLITIAIFTIIATAIYSSLSAGIRVWNHSNRAIEEFQSMRIFFAMLSADLRNAVVYDIQGANFEAAPGRMTFMALVMIAGKERKIGTELAKVTYYLDGAAKTVNRAVAGKAEGFDLNKAKAVGVLTGIENKDFDIEYCYKEAAGGSGYEWKREWADTRKVPSGVRIRTGDVTRYVFIPTGTMGGGE